MIRFRNPGTQYTTQVQVFKELYKEYKDAPSFDLDDMASTITKTKLMTAYGYAGEAALALSNTENDSLNSTKMNAKMYAEVFRLLGWITSVGNGSYPLVFTYIGEHAASTDDVLPLYEQCVLGINNPQEIMDVKYDEKVRFFKAALFSLEDLDGIMYKHELCLGPMSIDDLDEKQYRKMIAYLRGLRGSYRRYEVAYKALCDDLQVKPTLPDNSTRLPIAFMKTCGWILPDINRADAIINNISLTVAASGSHHEGDLEVTEFTQDVLELKAAGKRKQQIIEKLFDESITATQTRFYPFVAMLFRVMGLDCQASRPGDNGARWDAIIVDSEESIPIEIKSPTEEQHLSLKAIRQALENKVILLSRETHPTLPETTSLAVGYYLPNDRAEVTNLMSDFKTAYGYNIGIMDLKTLLTIAVTIIYDEKTFNIAELNRLEGFANATFN